MILLKSPAELTKMREAGKLVAHTLNEIREAIKPGVSTYDLDQIAVRIFEQHGARPAFLHYPPGGEHPFPATITASINDEIVHGIPSKERILHEGDIISIDTGCHYRGYVGDAAFTVGVGNISPEAQHLLEVTEQALYVGIKASQAGKTLQELGKAIQNFVEGHGYNVIREYTGHGVGRSMHEDPEIFNWWPSSPRERRQWRRKMRFENAVLRPGMTYALEPMVSMGTYETRELDDHWTVVTADGSLSAHFEHTIAIIDDEPLILTLP